MLLCKYETCRNIRQGRAFGVRMPIAGGQAQAYEESEKLVMYPGSISHDSHRVVVFDIGHSGKTI